MRTIRIYQATDLVVGNTLTLSPEASLHVGVVLRRQPGDSITLFCGNNNEYEANIIAVDKKKVSVIILSEKIANKESPLAIHLAQAISKGDRMETVVQKAVELGVKSITPIFTDRCVVKLDKERLDKKISQWQAIAIAACEQCGRNYVPIIKPALTLSAYLAEKRHDLNFVLYPEAAKRWRDYTVPSSANIGLFIGPEGGLTQDEIQEILHNGFSPLTLGPRILRTETAAIAAISMLQAVFGDL